MNNRYDLYKLLAQGKVEEIEKRWPTPLPLYPYDDEDRYCHGTGYTQDSLGWRATFYFQNSKTLEWILTKHPTEMPPFEDWRQVTSGYRVRQFTCENLVLLQKYRPDWISAIWEFLSKIRNPGISGRYLKLVRRLLDAVPETYDEEFALACFVHRSPYVLPVASAGKTIPVERIEEHFLAAPPLPLWNYATHHSYPNFETLIFSQRVYVPSEAVIALWYAKQDLVRLAFLYEGLGMFDPVRIKELRCQLTTPLEKLLWRGTNFALATLAWASRERPRRTTFYHALYNGDVGVVHWLLRRGYRFDGSTGNLGRIGVECIRLLVNFSEKEIGERLSEKLGIWHGQKSLLDAVTRRVNRISISS